MANGPLHNLKVLDLTRILAGPSCTQMLGDLGADIIKIEKPGMGDDTRRFAPPFIRDSNDKETNESAYFCSTNRNKRSVTLDLTQVEGQKIALKLLEHCDILVENFKTGGLKKYGLGYEQLKSKFPRLVYCSITGFGHTGPYAERPGYDVLIQAMGGFMSVTGEPDGPPQKAGVPISDLMAGMYAGVAINAALRHREITGRGQFIDIGMLDTTAAILSIMGANYLATGDNPNRLGNAHPNIVPYQAFATSDGNIILAVGNDDQFNRFCQFAGAEHLINDDRFATNSLRVKNRKILIPILTEIILQKPSQFWLKGLEAQKVSCGPINTIKEVFNDPQINSRNMMLKMQHPKTPGNDIKLIGSPLKMSDTPVTYRYTPPLLGEHTTEILKNLLKMTSQEIEQLQKNGVI